jgi:hypothetical protein
MSLSGDNIVLLPKQDRASEGWLEGSYGRSKGSVHVERDSKSSNDEFVKDHLVLYLLGKIHGVDIPYPWRGRRREVSGHTRCKTGCVPPGERMVVICNNKNV